MNERASVFGKNSVELSLGWTEEIIQTQPREARGERFYKHAGENVLLVNVDVAKVDSLFTLPSSVLAKTTIRMSEHMAKRVFFLLLHESLSQSACNMHTHTLGGSIPMYVENNLWKKFDSRKDNLISFCFECVRVCACVLKRIRS